MTSLNFEYNPTLYNSYVSRLSWGNYSVCPFCCYPLLDCRLSKSGKSVVTKCRGCTYQLMRVKPSMSHYLIGLGEHLANAEKEDQHSYRQNWVNYLRKISMQRFASQEFAFVKEEGSDQYVLYRGEHPYRAFCYCCGVPTATYRKDKKGRPYLSHSKSCGSNVFFHTDTSFMGSLGLSIHFENVNHFVYWSELYKRGSEIWKSWHVSKTTSNDSSSTSSEQSDSKTSQTVM